MDGAESKFGSTFLEKWGVAGVTADAVREGALSRVNRLGIRGNSAETWARRGARWCKINYKCAFGWA